jgi:predicted nucleic acid-binding Zn ribbon protein
VTAGPSRRSYRRGLTPLAPVLGNVRDELAPDTLLAEAQRAWAEAVGPAIAAEAQPTSERAGVLTVSCSASVWAQELDLMAPVILGQLNSLLPAGQLTRLRCVTVPPRSDYD